MNNLVSPLNDDDRAYLLTRILTLRLPNLDEEVFEKFFVSFLNARIDLTIERDGEAFTRRVIEATTYNAGSGRKQKGVDLIATMEGGETWAFQCKRYKKWTWSQTEAAIEKAKEFKKADHYFLLVGCNPHQDVQDKIAGYLNWSFWNLDRICSEFRLRVPISKQPQCLSFLSAEELRVFAPYATDALVTVDDFYNAAQKARSSFHHDRPLIGRAAELESLIEFAVDESPQVLLLSAVGGQGKSRLLIEFARQLEARRTDIEVLFLNPRRTTSVLPALADRSQRRVILVDDAHRIDAIPPEILNFCSLNQAAKLVLAARPQGEEALRSKLCEHQLSEIIREKLKALEVKDLKQLAREALGESHAEHADALVGLGRNPFLVAVAGDLIRQGKLEWTQLGSNDEFRILVYRAFLNENLAIFPEGSERNLARNLLKMVSLAAPIQNRDALEGAAGKILGMSATEVEDLLKQLKQTGLLAGGGKGLRVVPDLVSDFINFETAFDPQKRQPRFLGQLIDEFPDYQPQIIRNLAEASWIDERYADGTSKVLRPIVDRQIQAFRQSTFYERSLIIGRWSQFSVFLPEESLELAEIALDETTAPESSEESPFDLELDRSINSHEYLCSSLPALLKPIVLWQDEWRHQALDLIWEVGLLAKAPDCPTLSEIGKLEQHKSVAVVESYLDWVMNLVQQPEFESATTPKNDLIRSFLEPCFARLIDFQEYENQTIRWWQQPVSLEKTAGIRDRVFQILTWLINNRDWPVALQVSEVLETAMSGITDRELNLAREPEQYRSRWRIERLKALRLLEAILEIHQHPLVRQQVRQMLLLKAAFEDDQEFKAELETALNAIVLDFEGRLLNVLLSDGSFEFANEGEEWIGPSKQVEDRWMINAQEVIAEFVKARPQSSDAADFLEAVYQDCTKGGLSPNLRRFFNVLSENHPVYAIQLADHFLTATCSSPIATNWPHLISNLPPDYRTTLLSLLEKAVAHPRGDMRRGVIDYINLRDYRGNPTDGERVLIEQTLKAAGLDEIQAFLRFLHWMHPSAAPWAYELLTTLSFKEFLLRNVESTLTRLVPHKTPDVEIPINVVEHVLDQLVAVPEVEVQGENYGFGFFLKEYPKAVFDFIVNRIEHHCSAGTVKGYAPIPKVYGRRMSFKIPALSQTPEYRQICESVWSESTSHDNSLRRYYFGKLFKSTVLDDTAFWIPRMLYEIDSAASLDRMEYLISLTNDGESWVFIKFPDLAATCLRRAREIDRRKGPTLIRSSLYVAMSSSARPATKADTALASEAAKAAESQKDYPLLRDFYSYIVEAEKSSSELFQRHSMDEDEYDADE